MPKVNGRYKKKPYIPNYNPNAMTREQRLALKEYIQAVRSKSVKTGNHNLRKTQ